MIILLPIYPVERSIIHDRSLDRATRQRVVDHATGDRAFGQPAHVLPAERDAGPLAVGRAQVVAGVAVFAVYEARYGESPVAVYGLPQAYDATTMLLRAVEEVAVVDGDTVYIDRARLREALTAVDGFTGLIGTISCDDFGDCSPGRPNVVRHTTPGVTDITELPIVYRYES